MCYNRNCEIKIVSSIDGEQQTISTHGKLIKTSPLMQIDYALDADQCTLILKSTEIVQIRRGEQNVTITFREGEETACVLGSGEFSGTLPIFTERLHRSTMTVHSRRQAVCIYTITISYTLGEQKIVLDFRVKYKI